MKYGRLILATAISLGLHGIVLSYPIQEPQISFEEESHTPSVSVRFMSAPPPSKVEKVVEKQQEPKPTEPEVVKQPEPPKPKKPEVQKPEPKKVVKKPIPVKEPIKKQPKPVEPKQVVKKVEPQKPETKKPKPKKIEPVKEVVKKTEKKSVSENKPQPEAPSMSVAASKPSKPQMVEKPTFKVKPKAVRYPRLAKKKGWQGLSVIEIWVDEDGKQTKQVIVDSSGHKILDEAALKAVAKWQLERQTAAGQGLAYRVQIPVNFQLK